MALPEAEKKISPDNIARFFRAESKSLSGFQMPNHGSKPPVAEGTGENGISADNQMCGRLLE